MSQMGFFCQAKINVDNCDRRSSIDGDWLVPLGSTGGGSTGVKRGSQAVRPLFELQLVPDVQVAPDVHCPVVHRDPATMLVQVW